MVKFICFLRRPLVNMGPKSGLHVKLLFLQQIFILSVQSYLYHYVRVEFILFVRRSLYKHGTPKSPASKVTYHTAKMYYCSVVAHYPSCKGEILFVSCVWTPGKHGARKCLPFSRACISLHVFLNFCFHSNCG